MVTRHPGGLVKGTDVGSLLSLSQQHRSLAFDQSPVQLRKCVRSDAWFPVEDRSSTAWMAGWRSFGRMSLSRSQQMETSSNWIKKNTTGSKEKTRSTKTSPSPLVPWSPHLLVILFRWSGGLLLCYFSATCPFKCMPWAFVMVLGCFGAFYQKKGRELRGILQCSRRLGCELAPSCGDQLTRVFGSPLGGGAASSPPTPFHAGHEKPENMSLVRSGKGTAPSPQPPFQRHAI